MRVADDTAPPSRAHYETALRWAHESQLALHRPLQTANGMPRRTVKLDYIRIGSIALHESGRNADRQRSKISRMSFISRLAERAERGLLNRAIARDSQSALVFPADPVSVGRYMTGRRTAAALLCPIEDHHVPSPDRSHHQHRRFEACRHQPQAFGKYARGRSREINSGEQGIGRGWRRLRAAVRSACISALFPPPPLPSRSADDGMLGAARRFRIGLHSRHVLFAQFELKWRRRHGHRQPNDNGWTGSRWACRAR